MNLSEIGPVALVGAGKMGLALARGWIAGGLPPDRLVLCDPKPGEAAVQFAAEHGVRLLPSPLGVLTHVLVLAVKPQVIYDVMAEIRPVVGSYTLVLSIAAGIPLVGLSEGLQTERVIRTMPNTPAQVGRGITGAVGLAVSDEDRAVANALLSAAGQVMWFDDERKIDAVTAVSGSGPAYVFYLVEALAEAARKQGFDDEQAMQLARATVTGAAALLEAEKDTPASQLRINVTSPKGTTAAALDVLMAPDGLQPLMDRAVDAARRRSEELGRA
ncbi:pyrroline-5-carboxylate reductase [Devosia sp.]|uniref:pyrroline-5-carboxylate reductase n=1 Tax=Devosia sp. TaxID=1871048 RepID=UPI001AC02F4E|nr:pyrroline-5-carboxylate reductase [Devosia sp.]MBN9308097.1 pyrroline-5-carboxylate reductase [Devosia sp.]